jgi:hypothetical protein
LRLELYEFLRGILYTADTSSHVLERKYMKYWNQLRIRKGIMAILESWWSPILDLFGSL